MLKRGLSLLLALMMMLTLVTPVYAEAIEGQTTIKLKIRPQQGEWKYIEKTYSGRDNSTYYAVELYAETDEETFKLSGAQFYLNFDKDVLEFRTLKSTDDESIKYDEEDNENALNVTQPTPSECNSKGYVPLILSCNTNHVLKSGITLVTAVFTVKQNAESGVANFTLAAPENAEKETMCSFNVTENGKPVVTSHTVDDSATATVTINGVAPTLGKVTLTDAKNNLVLDTLNSKLKFDKLEVNGTTDYTYQARAWSTSGKEITGNVTWKLKSGSNFYDELNGATISEAGLLTIPSDAGAELSVNFFSFWVVATPKDGVSGNAIETNNIQINHKEQKIKTIQIRRKDGETGALIIPGTGEAAATAEFVATCTNQYDKPYTGNQTVYWNYERVGSQYGVKTVGFINTTATGATLKAEAGAADSVTDSATLKVKVYAGDINDRVYSNEVEITVQRDNLQRPAKIEISGAGTIAVPTTGEKKETYTATVYDQYGTEITNPGTIEWKLYDEYGKEHPLNGVNIANGVVTVTKEAAKNSFNDDGMRNIRVRAYCGEVYGESGAVHLTREKATVTSLVLDGDAEIAVPKNGEAEVTRSYLNASDQYGVEMNSSNLTIEWKKDANVKGVNFVNGGIKVSSDAAGNDFNEGKCQFTITAKYHKNGKLIAEATKTITLTRDSAEAKTMIWGTDRPVEVPANDNGKADANVTVTVYDQYGQKMTDAKVVLDGEQEGFVWEGGKLYVTKAAKTHFGGERQDEVTVYVRLKSGAASATVPVKLKLEAAQTNPSSAEISGPTSIAKPTGEQSNTAEYSILNNEMKDQYGLPLTFDPTKLTMTLEDKEDESGFSVKDGPVTLSGPVDGKWTITVTSGAVVNTKYYLKAKYSDMQCAPVKEITIVDKTVSNTLTVTQGDFTYGEEGKLNPVVKKDGETITNAAFVYTKGGQTVTEVKDAGKYTVTATCEDANYIYTGSVDFQILPKKIEVDWIELDGTRYTYNGQQQTVQYTVKDGDEPLVEGRDYTAAGDSGTNAGPYLLEITGKGNYYSDPDATVPTSVTWNIWALPVRISTATFQPRTYAKDDYSAALDTLTLVADKDGVVMPDNLTEGNGFTVSDIRVANNNAGQQPVSFKVTLTNTNYKWKNETGNIFNVSESAGFEVTINKIDHQAEAVSAEGKYGSTVRVPLAEYLPDGWSVQQSAISVDSNGNGNVHKSFRLEDTTLVVELNNNEALVGKYVKITLPVASTNYNPFTITVTVTVQNKKTQTVTANDLNVTYGDAGVKLNASALDNAKLTYQVTEGADVVAVDANGNVTLRKSGTAKIKITAAETEDYGTANTTVTVTVAKRSLTVKANDLTAYVGGQLPALDYTVTGLVSGDTLTTVPELELKDVPAGVDPMKTAGTYTIGFKTAPVADKDKYDLTVETGTLTVSSRPNVNPVPAGNSVKLEEAAGGKLTSSVSRATKGTTVTITVKPDAGYQLEELEVLDKNGEALPLKELANGKFSFQMPDSKVTVQASFVQESTYAGYPDVLPQDWFYSSVRYVTERGLMNGTPNGFEPNMDSSRATIWTILARFSGVDTTVVSGEWYAVARQWAMENGVSDGTNPNGVITREQLATMLYRFAKNKGLVQEPVTADLSVFVDAGQISDYALDAMRWAVSVGLLNGMDGSRLAPQGSAARAQVAAMLMRFDQLAK